MELGNLWFTKITSDDYLMSIPGLVCPLLAEEKPWKDGPLSCTMYLQVAIQKWEWVFAHTVSWAIKLYISHLSSQH